MKKSGLTSNDNYFYAKNSELAALIKKVVSNEPDDTTTLETIIQIIKDESFFEGRTSVHAPQLFQEQLKVKYVPVNPNAQYLNMPEIH